MAAAVPASPEAKKIRSFPDSVLLDRSGRVFCYDDKEAAAAMIGTFLGVCCYDDKDVAAAAVEDAAGAVAVETSKGQLGFFSFNLRPAPTVSYLNLHWPYGASNSVTPTVVSGDGPLLLLRIEFDEMLSYSTAPDMFVYTAGTSSPPSLRRLPTCTLRPEGLSVRTLFLKVERGVEILCRGGDQDDYVVSDLRVSWKAGGDPCGINPSPVIAMLCVFSSRTGEWMTHQMLAPQPQGQGQFPFFWYSDRSFPFAGRFICWVDYYSGVLLGDFSKDDSPVLSYVQFPGKQYPLDDPIRFDRGYPEAFRSLSTSQDKIYFIQIGDGWQKTGNTCQRNDESITIWTLNTTGQNFIWERKCLINLNVLWADYAYQAKDLPHHPPEFPVMAKDDPTVLFCVLREREFCWTGKAWIIMLDIKNASLRSSVPYINEQVAFCFKGADMGNDHYFCNVPFLPTDFSKHLKKEPEGAYS